MKTEQTTGKEIDFRKDTPPTDWLGKRVKERYGHLPPADIKTTFDYHKEFIAELAELRCKPNCANGNGNTNSGADGQLTDGQLTDGQLGASCICALLAEMTNEKAHLVPKREFMAVVEAAGYNQEDALAHYRNYFREKQWDEYESEFNRLDMERENAHNWWSELRSDEARAQASAARAEIRALKHKMDQELEAAMSA